MTQRYALYFAPDTNSELAAFGAVALGRTSTVARNSSQATSSYTDIEFWLRKTQSPAHYGFHATLKAPFELRSDTNISDLKHALETYCGKQAPINLRSLAPRHFGACAALTLEHQSAALSTLAFDIVETFEPFRQPLSQQDLQRRKRQPLTKHQLDLLQHYGYPYVADQFKFHMTLSESLTHEETGYVKWLSALYNQKITTTPQLDRIAIYYQANRSTAFTELCGFPLSKQV